MKELNLLLLAQLDSLETSLMSRAISVNECFNRVDTMSKNILSSKIVNSKTLNSFLNLVILLCDQIIIRQTECDKLFNERKKELAQMQKESEQLKECRINALALRAEVNKNKL